jgi:hypothetical protein
LLNWLVMDGLADCCVGRAFDTGTFVLLLPWLWMG